jgi:hypothetical protein
MALPVSEAGTAWMMNRHGGKGEADPDSGYSRGDESFPQGPVFQSEEQG